MNWLRFGVALGLTLRALVGASEVRAQVAPTARAEKSQQKGALSDEAELARVISLYEAGKYAECSDEFAHLLDSRSPRPLKNPEVVERGRLYHAACLIGRGAPELSDEPLRAAIRHNPQMKPPDSLDFPPPVVERFLRVRETLLEEIRAREEERVRQAKEQALAEERKVQAERARLRELERAMQKEPIIIRNRRWFALVPFGVGQFQNGNAGLGWTFFVSEALLAGSALTALAVRTHLELEAEQIRQSGKRVDPAINQRLENWHTLFVGSSWGLLAVMLGGIVEAEISFVPELRSSRPRRVPLQVNTSRSRGPDWNLTLVWAGSSVGLKGHF